MILMIPVIPGEKVLFFIINLSSSTILLSGEELQAEGYSTEQRDVERSFLFRVYLKKVNNSSGVDTLGLEGLACKNGEFASQVICMGHILFVRAVRFAETSARVF
jgi:hypothetical protein